MTVHPEVRGSLCDWERFARLKESGVDLELVVECRTLTSKTMDLAQRLDLHRLATHASLAHVPDLPKSGDAPAVVVDSGASWGCGCTDPMNRG